MLFFYLQQIDKQGHEWPSNPQHPLQCCFHIDRNMGLDVHPQREIKLKKAYEVKHC